MRFLKWLFEQYKEYKFQETFQDKDEAEKEKEFISNYTKCIEAGFSKKQLNSLIELFGGIINGRKII